MLKVQGLSRSYGDVKAVVEASFTIETGEIIGLLGHNGAGKTTLMKMLSGYLEPDTGWVQLDNVDLASAPKQVQAQIGYLPENLPVYGEMSVADYLDYCADLKGLSGSVKISEIQRAIAATDVGEKLAAPISTLSRGFKQRVGVAQAILGRPKLLILDEPTNGLDPEQTQLMRQLIRDIAKTATVILSTHIMQEVEALCSRVLIMHAGQLTIDESLEALRSSREIILSSTLPEAALSELEKFDGVNSVEAGKVPGDFTIALVVHANQRRLASAIAQFVFDRNAQLYELSHKRRDLESVFQEVSRFEPTNPAERNQEVANAA